MDLYYHLLSRFYLLQVLPTTSIHSIDATTNVVAANATTTINKIIIIKIKKWSKTMDKNHNQLIFSRRKRHELMMIKQDTEQTKRKGKNPRTETSAQQSKTEPEREEAASSSSSVEKPMAATPPRPVKPERDREPPQPEKFQAATCTRGRTPPEKAPKPVTKSERKMRDYEKSLLPHL